MLVGSDGQWFKLNVPNAPPALVDGACAILGKETSFYHFILHGGRSMRGSLMQDTGNTYLLQLPVSSVTVGSPAYFASLRVSLVFLWVFYTGFPILLCF